MPDGSKQESNQPADRSISRIDIGDEGDKKQAGSTFKTTVKEVDEPENEKMPSQLTARKR